jgi:predicted dehydrogenase
VGRGEKALNTAVERTRIGVIGAGAMGTNHVRVLSRLPDTELVGVYDVVPEKAEGVAAEHGTRAFGEIEQLIDAADGLVLATPTVSHAEVGCGILRRGCHLLVEKPIAANLADADDLVVAAEGLQLAVGHVEFFNPAVQALLASDIGKPGFVEIHRLAAFSRRSLDIDVVLDLMIHDLQILHALDGSELSELRATGVRVLSERPDIANARLELSSGCVANVTASRVSAERIRKLRVFSPPNYFSIDYQAQEVNGVALEVGEGRRRFVPTQLEVQPGDSLERELSAFSAAIRGRKPRLVDGRQGRRALATALAVVEAMAERADDYEHNGGA